MDPFYKIGLDIATATDATARALIPHSGKGDKNRSDQVAVAALRDALNRLPLRMRISIGEGEKDNAPMLYEGEILGAPVKENSEILDLIVDPLECTTNFAMGLPDSMVVLAALPEGTIQKIPGTYMDQLLLPPSLSSLVREGIDLDTPIPDLLGAVAKKLNHPIEELTVVIQNRPRHQSLINEVRKLGSGISLIESGSISAAMEILHGKSGRLLLLKGIFGAPEGLILALLARECGGKFLGRIAPHDSKSREETEKLKLENRTLSENEWITANGALVMTGIHSSPLLPGVEYSRVGSSFKTRTLLWTGSKRYSITHTNGRRDEIRELNEG